LDKEDILKTNHGEAVLDKPQFREVPFKTQAGLFIKRGMVGMSSSVIATSAVAMFG